MALSISEEGLDLAAVLLGVGLVEGGHEEAAGAKLTAGQRALRHAGAGACLVVSACASADLAYKH